MTYDGEEFDLIIKSSDWLMRIIGWFLPASFMSDYWTTYRLPFMRTARVCYGTAETNPTARFDMFAHEVHHVRQFKPWYGPVLVILAVTLLPLPVLFSGRWFVERQAYADDVKAGRYTVDEAVDELWRGYAFPWPRSLMKRWLLKHTAT